ncbi:hypothetical protein FQN49_003868 [Arthroderma sp. PD_2]|nr:hypothetical protein FQN49_003868 [Arthroderma sp. PD_2]
MSGYNDNQQRGESAGYYNPGDLSLDQDQAIRQAQYHKNGREDHEDDDSSLFSKAMGFLGDNKEKLGREDIDEERVVNSHQKLYGDADDRNEKHGAESLGSGAAMQALKMFMDDSGKQDNNQGQNQGQKQGGDQNKLIGIAMAQAGKMWEQKNQEGRVDTDKQTAVNMAAQYALKMYLKGQMGGSGGGGLGGLGGLALISGALGGGGQQNQSGLSAIAGALGGSGGQQQNQQQGGAANLMGMASKFL